MCGFQYNDIVEQIKKTREDPIVIPIHDAVQEDKNSDEDMDDIYDDVHVW